MEEKLSSNDLGVVKIADDVVSVIAGLATAEITGIVGMNTGIVGGISQIFSGKKNNPTKGVKVTTVEDEVIVDLDVIVEYGVKIQEVAKNVQESVKNSIESMTGLNVAAVNVYVQNINIPKDETLEEEILPVEEE